MRKLIILVSVIALAAMLSGCCSVCNFSKSFDIGMSKNVYTLGSYSFEETDVSLTEGDVLNYTVSSNGPAVDIYILDEENFELLKANSTEWVELHSDYADPVVSGQFIAPETRTYYFVVDNYNEQSAVVNTDLKW
ncbi:hypothetical protein [Methanocella sp. MCL-LM]|uniref:hypothetical protein n=1 Tax=Methanocella sp. MCL-LM TaxID=3412035 RepID=UPI003C73CC75